MGKRKIDPDVISKTSQELVDNIAHHIVPIGDPRSCFGFNLWFKRAPLNVYIRQGRRANAVTREWVYTLEIASVDVKESAQKQGYFGVFLTRMEILAEKHGLNVLVENVHNEHLRAFMERRGYQLYRPVGDPGGWPPTYWRV